MTTQLHLQGSPGFIDGLNQLVTDTGLSRDELVRQSVALYWHAREQHRQGRTLGFFSEEDGRTVVKTTVTL